MERRGRRGDGDDAVHRDVDALLASRARDEAAEDAAGCVDMAFFVPLSALAGAVAIAAWNRVPGPVAVRGLAAAATWLGVAAAFFWPLAQLERAGRIAVYGCVALFGIGAVVDGLVRGDDWATETALICAAALAIVGGRALLGRVRLRPPSWTP